MFRIKTKRAEQSWISAWTAILFLCGVGHMEGPAVGDEEGRDLVLDGRWALFLEQIPKSVTRANVPTEILGNRVLSARVPGTVQGALADAALTLDPYVGKRAKELRWVEACSWNWNREFEWTALEPGMQADLVFEGLSYASEVFLNGRPLGSTEGLFGEHRFSVGELLVPGKNKLSVILEGPRGAGPKEGSALQSIISSNLVCPMWGRSEGTAATMIPLGIWRSVRIERWEHARLSSPYVIVHSLERGEAQCELQFHVEEVVDQPRELSEIQVKFAGLNDESVTLKKISWNPPNPLRKGQLLRHDFIWEDPPLWSPKDDGEQTLLRCMASLKAGDGEVLSSCSGKVGLRTVRWEGFGSGKPVRLKVNGHGVPLRGLTWLPMDSLLGWDPGEYESLLRLVQHAGINLVRVWGGGVTEDEAFYQFCDDHGILCIQEFWLTQEEYPWLSKELFLEAAEKEIFRLRSHPSLILLCGGDRLRSDCKDTEELVGGLKDLFLDRAPDRPFLPSFLDEAVQRKLTLGEDLGPHWQRGWPEEWVYVHYPQSLPDWSVVSRFQEGKALKKTPEAWTIHGANFQELSRYASRYGFPRNRTQLYERGRLSQAVAARFQAFTCRFSERHGGGFMGWRLNDTWPSVSGSLVDFSSRPKPAFFLLRRALLSHAVCCLYEDAVVHRGECFLAELVGFVPIGVEREVTLEMTLFSDSGEKLQDLQRRGRSDALGRVHFGTFRWEIPEPLKRRTFLLFLRLRDGNQTADHCCWFASTSYKIPDQWIEFSEGWRFMLDPTSVGERKGWHQDPLDDSTWEEIQIDKPWLEPTSGTFQGMAWYRHRFDVPEAWEGIEFEILFWTHGHAKAFLNGRELQELQPSDGGRPLYRAVLPREAVIWGAKNLVVVQVQDDGKGGGMYHGMIFRPTIHRKVLQRLTLERNTAFRALGSLPRCRLEAVPARDGGVRIKNEGPVFAFGIWVDAPRPGMADNMFFLLPGEEAECLPLCGRHHSKENLKVSCWNAASLEVSVGQEETGGMDDGGD